MSHDNIELKKRKYNETICFMWEKQSGNLMSMEIDEIMFDKIQKLKLGDKIMVKRMPAKKTATSPDAALEIMDKESVERFKAERAAARNNEERNPSSAQGDSESI